MIATSVVFQLFLIYSGSLLIIFRISFFQISSVAFYKNIHKKKQKEQKESKRKQKKEKEIKIKQKKTKKSKRKQKKK
jgi:hypothetical protein